MCLCASSIKSAIFKCRAVSCYQWSSECNSWRNVDLCLSLFACYSVTRCSLSSVVLQLLALGVPDVPNFDFMDKPTPEAMDAAFEHLKLLGAVEQAKKGGDFKLTQAGKTMAAFPVDPGLSKTLLSANEKGCVEEMLTIVSLLSSDSIMFTPRHKREEANAVRRKFMSPDGDHLTMLNVYRGYKAAKGNKKWCFENFINGKNMKVATEIRGQLREICIKQNFVMKSCGKDTSMVRECLSNGFYMNVAELQKDGHYRTVASKRHVWIHPSSVLFGMKPTVLVYNEFIHTDRSYIRDLSVVDADWLYQIAPEYFRRKLISYR